MDQCEGGRIVSGAVQLLFHNEGCHGFRLLLLLPGKMIVGRFAPSPTGPLHLGSLVAALGSYALAREGGGRWLLRMEDLDTPRIVPGCSDDILRTLELLGFEWDGPVIRQSQRIEAYQAVLEKLQA